MYLTADFLRRRMRPGGRHGLSSSETRDPIGLAVAGLNRLARSEVIDRLGLRRQAEQAVFTVTRSGFRTATAAGRQFARLGTRGAPGTRPEAARADGLFDLTPTEDEQMLVDVVAGFAREVVRPAAAEADTACAAPESVLAAAVEIGLPILGVPEALGGISEERSAMAGTLVAEALAHGDMGLAVAALAPGSVATALGLWGTDAQQQTYLPAFTGGRRPGRRAGADRADGALRPARRRPPRPAATATATSSTASSPAVVTRGRGRAASSSAPTSRARPVLFLVESSAEGLTVEADPSMGVRAASLTRLSLDRGAGARRRRPRRDRRDDVRRVRAAVPPRLVRPRGGHRAGGPGLRHAYVNEREAFGEPISHRQAVAFMVADIAIELQAMRLVTYKAASRAARGKDFAREVALARSLCSTKGMRIGLDGVQLLGGHGFVKEHPVERWYRDLRAVGIMEGSVLV